MDVRPSILCPIDYSDSSAGALRTAAAIASHFGTRLVVLVAEDPFLTEACDLATGVHWTPDLSRQELERFTAKTFGSESPVLGTLEYDVAVGKPAVEILRVARERSCDLIVMSSHGFTGVRKLFFGSTTERVLRETRRPVLVTPAADHGLAQLDDAPRLVRRILVPVDLTPASSYQSKVAAGLADALGLGLIFVHVIEPGKGHLAARLHLPNVQSDRRAIAEDSLSPLVAMVPPGVHTESLVVFGEPAEELAKVARDRQAGLIIMGLHSSPLLGPRMGSVTYRLLCLSPALVLALPPMPVAVADQSSETSTPMLTAVVQL